MSKIQFTKSALSPEQLLTKLKGQGLLVDCDQDALRYLQFVGGFRLKAYWYPRQDPQTKQFCHGTRFSKIIEEYEFDRGLRAVAFVAIERLEIAIRSTMANRLAIAHGPHWYLKPEIFKPNARWTFGQMLSKIEREVGLAERQVFIQSYNKKYDDPYIAQSWAMTECVSFGFWSKTYNILRLRDDKRAISLKFNVAIHEVFQSWLHTLSYFRNVVAHHDRLLRTNLAISPLRYSAGRIHFRQTNGSFTSNVYAVMVIMAYLTKASGLSSTFKCDLQTHFAKFPEIDISQIGFPKDWADRPEWN